MVRVVPEEAARLLPGSPANDPSVELRYDAVELLVAAADACSRRKDTAGAKTAYRKALDAARQQKQIENRNRIGARSERAWTCRYLGFLTHWRVIGPFDNSNLTGFDTVDPPENKQQRGLSTKAKRAKSVGWKFQPVRMMESWI
jgi:hypothetical protein